MASVLAIPHEGDYNSELYLGGPLDSPDVNHSGSLRKRVRFSGDLPSFKDSRNFSVPDFSQPSLKDSRNFSVPDFSLLKTGIRKRNFTAPDLKKLLEDTLDSYAPPHKFSLEEIDIAPEADFPQEPTTVPNFVIPEPFHNPKDREFHRSDFPQDFVFGTATAAYQVEGAYNEGGRGLSIWDTFSHTPGKTFNGDHGDVAVNQYYKFQDDIDNLEKMHMNAYRFSISWSRIMHDGQGQINHEGIAYYNRLIDGLLKKGIEPYVTLYHWDMPQALEDSIGGWLSPEIVQHYVRYAEVCFNAFGDRVKNWITFNEPHNFVYFGYGSGWHAPGRTSDRSVSPVGDSATEPYIAAHHVVLSHARTVQLYRKSFQPVQGGCIGITMDNEWAIPMTNSPEDVAAAERRNLYQVGLFLDPIYFGDYPRCMREAAGSRLLTFTKQEKILLRNSKVDFIGINNYTTKYAKAVPQTKPGFFEDQRVMISPIKDGVPLGPQAFSFWLTVVPWGFQQLLLWLWNRYQTPIDVTENGMDTENLQKAGEEVPSESIHDSMRVQFYQDYMKHVLGAISKGVHIRSYFAWSLVDNFEWATGYKSRFGLFYVDYETQIRYPKDSAKWFMKFLKPKGKLEIKCVTM